MMRIQRVVFVTNRQVSQLLASARPVRYITSGRSGLRRNAEICLSHRGTHRLLSSSASKPVGDATENEPAGDSKDKQILNQKYVDEDGYYEETDGKGSQATAIVMLTAGLGFLALAIYYLWPSRMGANSVFSSAFDIVRINDEILAITGDPMKAYGRDVGRSTEGRRNFVDSREYQNPTDGSTRMRVRFNVKGPKGHCMVWAEVSNKMADNEYVYLICQDMRTGRVVTIEDNRDRLHIAAQQTSEAGANAMTALAGLFKK